ncbi:MAG TPA: hypothetical protein VJ801_06440, partial [Polyangia bacterium]|nr:hypothetical protein [Polyangia bacterium]
IRNDAAVKERDAARAELKGIQERIAALPGDSPIKRAAEALAEVGRLKARVAELAEMNVTTDDRLAAANNILRTERDVARAEVERLTKERDWQTQEITALNHCLQVTRARVDELKANAAERATDMVRMVEDYEKRERELVEALRPLVCHWPGCEREECEKARTLLARIDAERKGNAVTEPTRAVRVENGRLVWARDTKEGEPVTLTAAEMAMAGR